jgi:hypothetical protein
MDKLIVDSKSMHLIFIFTLELKHFYII